MLLEMLLVEQALLMAKQPPGRGGRRPRRPGAGRGRADPPGGLAGERTRKALEAPLQAQAAAPKKGGAGPYLPLRCPPLRQGQGDPARPSPPPAG